MAKVIPLQQALKVWVAVIGSGVLLYLGRELSDFLVRDRSAPPSLRWAGVAVAVVSVIPWMLMIAWGVSVADEYYRRVAIEGTALAFVVDLTVHVAFGTLVDAGLLASTSVLLEVPAAIITWMASIGIVLLYYRFRP